MRERNVTTIELVSRLAIESGRRIASYVAIAGVVASGVSLGLACKKDEATIDRRASPPPPPLETSAGKPGACGSGGGEVKDPVSASFFPRTLSSYCVDPQGETKTYGEKGKFSMDEVCTTAFDGECEIYKRFGLKRTVALRYVDGSGGAGSVELYLSEFKDTAGGYAMYTKRVVADADPADPSAPRVLAAGGAGAIGTGRAYVWKGAYLVELQYNNEQESPEKLAQSSESILSALGASIGTKLPGKGELPPAALSLPEEQRLPNGISYVTKEPLGLANVGAAAIGFYRDGERRYRVLSLVRDDVERAKDEMKTIRSRPGALPVAGIGDEAAVLIVQEGKDRPKSEYLFARKGARVLGVGDEELVTQPAEREGKGVAIRLSKDEKLAKLKAALTAVAPAAPASSSAKK
jgi:hypothetical protein